MYSLLRFACLAVCHILLGTPRIVPLVSPECDDGVVIAAEVVVLGGLVPSAPVEDDASVGTTGGACEINDGGS